ncbi:YARHG domain-containing protein [Clostridium sp. DJ247]|uniref:YARHG domain-containing protein n=1 Tax=Clostridium sp. DJ247 TaxID=2726188 RepID=UPI001624FBF7|nr:YARHG domain-containing protein [Clostridium sp. DJ247]MBC2582626.1 YARHG domain-containing protein [Clostridium sp. DJ247]
MSYCSKCGSILVNEAIFCHKCGVKQYKNDLMNNIQKVNLSKRNNIDRQAVLNISKKTAISKKFYNPIIIGALGGLIILSLGFGSYYICFSILSASNAKKANTYSKLIPKTNNASNDSTAAPTDKNQFDGSKADNSTNNVTSRINSSDDYIFPNSADKKLLDSDLSSLSKENLALARNEIFAIHGYVFETEPYKSYFNSKSWYKPNSNIKSNDEELNDVEKYNVQLILKYEKNKK